MPLTRSFHDTIVARLKRDPAFATAMLTEAIETLLAGDVQTGKAVLRDYINGTIGFEALSKATDIPVKSLMRMFGPSGNPTARTLFAVTRELQAASGVVLEFRRAA
jgi:DNA-binding phage protein